MNSRALKSGVLLLKYWDMNVGVKDERDNVKKGTFVMNARYQKHLDPLVSVGWNEEEERNLYRLHD